MLSDAKRYVAILLFFCFTLPVWVWASSIQCEKILSISPSDKAKSFQEVYQEYRSQVQNVLTGSRDPNWKDYSWILELKKTVTLSKVHNVDLKRLTADNREALKAFENSSNEEKKRYVDRAYPIFRQLEELNRILEFKLFPVEEYFPYALDEVTLRKMGSETVRSLEKRFRDHYHLSGHKNPVDMIFEVEKKNEIMKKAFELVNDKLIVTIRRPEGARFWVPLTGFQNQFVTGYSVAAGYDIVRRNREESSLSFQDLSLYTGASARYKPQYAEVRPAFEVQNLKFRTKAMSYGSDVWILKRSVINDRVTWTPRDSYGQSKATQDKQTSWDQMYIPWKHREFMAIYLTQGLQMGVFRSYPADPTLGIKDSGGSNEFIEAQIWGPVSIKDVSGFGFEWTPPAADFAAYLRSKKIKIWDLREEDNPKLYTEDLKP